MASYRIYHNPRCKKSRETLALLEADGITPEIILYLQDGVTETELAKLEILLGTDLSNFVRKKETAYKPLTGKALRKLVSQHPILLERPIVIKDNKKAVLGRPPENVRTLL